MDTRARFGFTAAPGSTDDARIRHLILACRLPPAACLRRPSLRCPASGRQRAAVARDTAEGLGEAYFRDGGRRAHGLEVEFTDVGQLDFDL
ncbi:hypothetical protein [Streptomyces sp. ME02-6987-2C]|uniref:hypothetical protein n=1 Tax=Streptomyces sp. ME02-6987-2C TaxID=3028676 RepID=UPI0039F6AA07